MAADSHGNEITDAQHDDNEKSGGDEQRADIAAERHAEPENGAGEAEPGVDKADYEIRDELAEHDFKRRNGRRDQLLHCPALPFARDGQRGEFGADKREDHRNHARDDEVAAVQGFVEPGAGLEIDLPDQGWPNALGGGPLRGDLRVGLRRCALGVAQRDIGRVHVGCIEDRLDRPAPGRRKPAREIDRNNDGADALAAVHGIADAGFAVKRTADREPVR